jgi:hypothetical protein
MRIAQASALKAITRFPYSDQMTWLRRIGLELVAQARDVLIDSP